MASYAPPVASTRHRERHAHTPHAPQTPVHPAAGVPVRPAAVGDLQGSIAVPSPSPRQQHPLLESLMHALGGSQTARPGSREQVQQRAQQQQQQHQYGSQTARQAASPSQSLRALPQQPAAIQSLRPRQQSSAAMRRKMQSLADAQFPLSPTHAAALADCDPAAVPAASAAHTDVLPSLLPPSARVYSRAPLTNFVVSLDSLPPSHRQWEQLVFPSPTPLADGTGGGETEVRRLTDWFEQAWAALEHNMQRAAAREKREQARRQVEQKVKERTQINGASEEEEAAAASVYEEKAATDPTASSSSPSSSPSPRLLHQLSLDREKLVYVVFTELLRQVSASSRVRAALLEKVWGAARTLGDARANYKLAEVVALSDAHSAAQLRSLSAECAELVRREHAAAIRLGVDLSYSAAALEAKGKIIAALADENDKDLLYSNQQVCAKEMALLRAEKALAQLEQDRAKESQTLRFLEDDRAQLEAQLLAAEGERDELAQSNHAIQAALDARFARQAARATQYDLSDLPPAPSHEEAREHAAAQAIQRTFRGFSTRRKLKVKGMLSRKQIMRKIHTTMHSATATTTGTGTGAGAGGGGGGAGAVAVAGANSRGHLLSASSLPHIPHAFAHLLHPWDMLVHRTHFMRLFPRRNLLKWIALLYAEYAAAVAASTKSSKSAAVTALSQQPRRPDFATFIYEFYLLRHGSRDSAEMDLLDLFASLAKFGGGGGGEQAQGQAQGQASARVRLFNTIINNGCRHRKIVSDKKLQQQQQQQQGAAAAAAAADSAEAEGASTSATAATSTPSYHMSSAERASLSLQVRLSHSLVGAVDLTGRVLDFVLKFGKFVSRYGRGPFASSSASGSGSGSSSSVASSVADNNEGVRWVDLSSLESLVSRAWSRLPQFMSRAIVDKMRHRAEEMRNREAHAQGQGQGSRATTATTAPGHNGNSSSNSSSTAAAATSFFVDYDVLLEVVVEGFIDEDARMHHTLMDAFKQQNAKSQGGGRAAGAGHAAKKSMGDIPPASSSFVAGASPGVPLDPELVSFSHFTSVLRSLGVSWSEDQCLSLFALAVQRARHRPVQLEDFVVTLRGVGIMPVDIDWGEQSEVRGGGGQEGQDGARGGGARAAHADGDLPSLDDDARVPAYAHAPSVSGSGVHGGYGISMSDDDLERRHAALKSKLRELESSAHSKLDHAARRHDRELTQLRQSHERDLASLQQHHQHQLAQQVRAAEAERARAAADYNALFESSQLELRALQRSHASKEQRQQAHTSASVSHFTQKLAEEARALELVQSKLASKSDKYNRKKAQLADMTQRALKAEAALLAITQAKAREAAATSF